MNQLLRVLVVEDSQDDTELMLRQIRRGGYEPQFERVDTPQGLIAALDKGVWDIVITDYIIPGFGGMDFGLPYDRHGARTGEMLFVRRIPEATLGMRSGDTRLTGLLRNSVVTDLDDRE